jgi:glutamate dehydrogenase/leucine dehydrogenase
MAVTASGLYGLTLEKMMNATALPTSGLESETAVKVLMVTDSEVPNFDTHDFRNDITAEVTGTGYTAGGVVITSTELTLASGVLTYDAADASWSSSTIANAMAAVGYFGRGGASSADELVFLSDFVTAASSSSGTFQIVWNAAGIYTVDYTP